MTPPLRTSAERDTRKFGRAQAGATARAEGGAGGEKGVEIEGGKRAISGFRRNAGNFR